jgi:hypothetical protein
MLPYNGLGGIDRRSTLPIHEKGALTFKNLQKMVKISSKRHGSSSQMMGLFLQNDLGIMKNVLEWFQRVMKLSKVNATLIKVHTTLDKVHATFNKVHTTLYDTCDT